MYGVAGGLNHSAWLLSHQHAAFIYFWSQIFQSTHRPEGGRTWWDILFIGAQLLGMHTDVFWNFILLFDQNWANLGEKKELLIKLKSRQFGCHLTALAQGLVDLLSCTSCVLTHIPLHSLTSHLNRPLLPAFALLQHGKEEKKAKMPKKQKTKQPLHVPQSLLLARHDNTVSPSFVSLGHVRQRLLFYFHQRKRSPPYPKTCLFMEMVEGWGRKHSWGNAVEKVLARSDLLFAGGGVQPEAGVFFLQAWIKYALDVWRTLIYGWNARPSFFITSTRGVSFLKDSEGSWSLGSSKG